VTSTAQCLLPWSHEPPPRPPTLLPKALHNYIITLPPILTQFWPIKPVTWYCMSTWMLPISPSHKHTAVLAATSTSAPLPLISQPLSINPNAQLPLKNGNVHVLCTILEVVVSSAAKAKLETFSYNGKEAAWLSASLADMGHPPTCQPTIHVPLVLPTTP
jgi:hypothetical protein